MDSVSDETMAAIAIVRFTDGAMVLAWALSDIDTGCLSQLVAWLRTQDAGIVERCSMRSPRALTRALPLVTRLAEPMPGNPVALVRGPDRLRDAVRRRGPVVILRLALLAAERFDVAAARKAGATEAARGAAS